MDIFTRFQSDKLTHRKQEQIPTYPEIDPSEEVDDVIIFDNGSSEHRAGFGGEAGPRIRFPSVVGHAQICTSLMSGLGSWYVGHDVLARQNSPLLDIRRPVQDGHVVDWEAMEELWRYSMKCKLSVHPEEHVVLHAVRADASAKHRENTAEVMFESFDVNGCALVSDASLSLLPITDTTSVSHRLHTGLVVNCGFQSCTATPVYESYAIPALSTKTKMSCGGQILDHLTMVLILQHGYSLTEAADIATELLETNSSVYSSRKFNNNYTHKERDIESEDLLQMKNGDKINIRNSLDKACESIFQPHLIDSNEKSLPDIITQAISNCDCELQEDMLQNIVLTGAGSQIKGLTRRLQAELREVYTGINVGVTQSKSPRNDVWRGGTLFAAKVEFENLLVSRTEYDENGPMVARRKCFM